MPVDRRLAAGLPVVVALVAGLALGAGAEDGEQTAQDLLVEAREAARTDRNAQSAELFERVLEKDPALRAQVLREYADQLTYAGRAAEAVPLFREVLAGEPSPEDRSRAERGLALALLWAGKHEDAVPAWDAIAAAAPEDGDAKANLQKAVVGQARDAARADRNKESAALFARAIDLDPGQRGSLLKEYADQLTYSGRPGTAIPLYDEVLANATGKDRQDARRNRALALLWSGKTAAAQAEWRAILGDAGGSDSDARRNLVRALTAEARRAAAADRNQQSADLFAEAIRLSPSLENDVGIEYAEQLTYSDRAKEAVPIFRSALARLDPQDPKAERARRGLALALSWSGSEHLNAALQAYDEVLSHNPNDVEALNGKARTLIWMDRSREARRVYRRALEVDPANTDARRGLAEADSFLGRQRAATEQLRGIIDSSAKADPETLLIAARAELWKGRPDKAHALVERLIANSPNHGAAGDLLAEIEDQGRPVTSLGVTTSTQDNGLDITTTNLRQSLTLNQGLTTIGAQYRKVTFDPETGGNVTLDGVGVFARHRIGDNLELNTSIHFNELDGPGFSYSEPTHDTWLTYWHGDQLRFDLSFGTSYFDDVQSLSQNIRMDTVGFSVDYHPLPDLKLSGRVSHGDVSDGNSRNMAQLEIESAVNGLEGANVGMKLTHFDFSRPDLSNGYFNPDWYYSAETAFRVRQRMGERWELGAQASLGYEWQPDDSKPIWSAGVSAAYDITDDVTFDAGLSHFDASTLNGGDGFSRTSLNGRLIYRW